MDGHHHGFGGVRVPLLNRTAWDLIWDMVAAELLSPVRILMGFIAVVRVWVTMEIAGSYSGSDVGGMYSSSFSSDYMSRGGHVGGSSYSSLYSSRGLGGSSYMGNGGSSGSYY